MRRAVLRSGKAFHFALWEELEQEDPTEVDQLGRRSNSPGKRVVDGHRADWPVVLQMQS